MTPLRGQLFRVDVGYGAKPWAVISNNHRNRNLTTVLALRITTTGKHAHQPTVVALGPADSLVGFALCDDVVQLYQDEVTAPIGALCPATMTRIGSGLRIALGL